MKGSLEEVNEYQAIEILYALNSSSTGDVDGLINTTLKAISKFTGAEGSLIPYGLLYLRPFRKVNFHEFNKQMEVSRGAN